MTNELISLILLLVLTIFSIFLIINLKEIRRQNNINITFNIFSILREFSHQEARKIVYETFLDYKIFKDLSIFRNEKIRKNSEMVKADFDEIGSLLFNNSLKPDLLFLLYSDTIVRSWLALKDDIYKERNERNSSDFMLLFEKLYTSANNYRIKNNLPEPSFVDFRNNS